MGFLPESFSQYLSADLLKKRPEFFFGDTRKFILDIGRDPMRVTPQSCHSFDGPDQNAGSEGTIIGAGSSVPYSRF
jgi:hypothetical protein